MQYFHVRLHMDRHSTAYFSSNCYQPTNSTLNGRNYYLCPYSMSNKREEDKSNTKVTCSLSEIHKETGARNVNTVVMATFFQSTFVLICFPG